MRVPARDRLWRQIFTTGKELDAVYRHEIATYAGFVLLLLLIFGLHIRSMMAIRRLRKKIWRTPLASYVVAEKKRNVPISVTLLPHSCEASSIHGFLKDFAKRKDNLLQQQGFIKFFKNCNLILDIGCGKGEFLELCRENRLAATGIDFSEEKIESCRRKNLEAYHANLFSYLSETDLSFDGIMCSHVIEHLSPEEFLAMTKLISQKIKLGGIFIILTPNPRSLRAHLYQFWKDMTHRRFYDIESICYLLEKSGFETIETGEV